MAHRPDGGNVIAELNNGTLTAKYLRGMNLISRTDSSRTTYYLFNAHGDVVDLANSSGSSVKSYDYDAFGNEKSPSASDRNPFRYCGEYWDTEAGTYYLRARYYDPLIGRFTQQDSHWTSANAIYGDNPNQLAQREDALGLTSYTYSPQINCILQSGNLYVYCINDPINGSDANGEIVHPIVVAAFVGGIGNLVADIALNASTYAEMFQSGNIGDLAFNAGKAFVAGAASGVVSATALPTGGKVVADALIGAIDSIASDVYTNITAGEGGEKYSTGDIIAHAVINAGASAVFSYAGSDSSGKEMSSLHKTAKTAEKTAGTKGTHPTVKKTAKKTVGTYNRKLKSSIGPSIKNSIASNAGSKATGKIYQEAYAYYTK